MTDKFLFEKSADKSANYEKVHEMSMSHTKGEACLGRGYKAILNIYDQWIDGELGRNTSLFDIVHASLVLAISVVATAACRSKSLEGVEEIFRSSKEFWDLAFEDARLRSMEDWKKSREKSDE